MAFQSEPAVVSQYLASLPDGEAHEERAELDKVRRDRVGWSELRHLGLAAVAAPVFGSREVQAAMALISTDQMLPASDRSQKMVEMLQDTAARLSKLVSA